MSGVMFLRATAVSLAMWFVIIYAIETAVEVLT